MVRQWQEIEYSGRYSHSYMDALPNFVKLAEAYGHVGMLIERPQDVEPALREARKLKDRTVFMDFRTDPTENVFPMVKAGKGITEMLLGSEDLCNDDSRSAARTRRLPSTSSLTNLLLAEPAHYRARGRAAKRGVLLT